VPLDSRFKGIRPDNILPLLRGGSFWPKYEAHCSRLGFSLREYGPSITGDQLRSSTHIEPSTVASKEMHPNFNWSS